MRNLLISVAVALCLGGTARADGPAGQTVATYALLVGSNAGGPGQTDLRYSEDDARRVGAVLTELGGYAPDTIDIVVHPTPDILRDRLAKLAARVGGDLAAGRQARVFFYYSGHARATAIDLGNDELPLAELRTRLFAVPATLTVVVLDACQSGAFSRVKGGAPAADFSFNSRERLDATGIAVLASSTGSELSQESEQLKSSYFTHNLLVGLRGAGDANNDGEVSIDEAYRYAYHQTLLATTETAVGGQHVTFEADLKGHGEVPLSFPRAATASIVLPLALEGQTLVEDRRAHAVVAETYKAKGAAVRIAVAPGDYDVLVRHGDRLSRCRVTAGPEGALVDVDHCTSEAIIVSASKGSGRFEHPYRLEVAGLLGGERDDTYTKRLIDLGYNEDGSVSAGLSILGLRQIHEKIWVGGMGTIESGPSYSRQADAGFSPQRFTWNLTTIGLVAHGQQPLGSSGLAARTSIYARVGAGVAMARTEFKDIMDVATDQTFFGPSLLMGAGLHFDSGSPGRLGVSMGYQFDYAPVIDNLIGDTHASGGHRFIAGLSYSF
jgi:hypothetical protein